MGMRSDFADFTWNGNPINVLIATAIAYELQNDPILSSEVILVWYIL
jgi:hypothetical protein